MTSNKAATIKLAEQEDCSDDDFNSIAAIFKPNFGVYRVGNLRGT